jgi:molybdopterin-guanine dinucleotide biosynthesis protein A
MDAILTAGGVPRPDEPLYAKTMGGFKALLDVNGKPLIQWVLDGLNGSRSISRIVIVGLPPDASLQSKKPLVFLEDHGDILNNIQAGALELLRNDPDTDKFLIVASDVPGATAEMIDWLVQRVKETDHDLYYFVVERSRMEKRYPGARRTYLRMKEIEVCGGDINAARASIFKKTNPLWDKIIEARKNPIKQASLLGFDFLLKVVFHQLTLQQAESSISKHLGIAGRVIVCPYAELGMDVDKPFQLDLVTSDLAGLSVK